MHLTEQERKAVELSVRALFCFQDELVERTADGNPHRETFRSESAEAILSRLGLGWRRQVALMALALRIARERGIRYRGDPRTTHGKLAR